MSEIQRRRVVVTGMGLASPIGNSPEAAWQTLLRGEHGVVDIRDTALAGYDSLPISVGAPVKSFSLLENPAFGGYKKEIRSKWDLSQQFALWAGAQALDQARLLPEDGLRVDENQIDPERFGIYMGTGIGGANVLGDSRAVLEMEKAVIERAREEDDEETLAKLIGGTRIDPKSIIRALPGRTGGTPSMVFNAKAFWGGILRECASGNAAIISAIEAIHLDNADVVLAGGTENGVTPVNIGMFGAARAVSRNPDPEGASRPFDRDRDGLVMGEGAGALIVESREHAIRRGAPILAEIVGYAVNADAKYETEPDPKNVVGCIRKAIGRMDRHYEDLRGVSLNTHATSTPVGDAAEMSAMTDAFRADQVVGIAATKAATGHMLGAAGAAEAIFSILSLRDNLTPPIRNLDQPLEEADGYQHLMSPSEPIEGKIEYVFNNSFGFSGNNAVTIFARHD
jgi:3-oxoacyl-[acyl-carrier-protein] synthase II